MANPQRTQVSPAWSATSQAQSAQIIPFESDQPAPLGSNRGARARPEEEDPNRPEPVDCSQTQVGADDSSAVFAAGAAISVLLKERRGKAEGANLPKLENRSGSL